MITYACACGGKLRWGAEEFYHCSECAREYDITLEDVECYGCNQLYQKNAELQEQVNRVDWCKWHVDEDGNWWTECDEGFVFNDGGPKENRMDFCPYCGSLIEIAERLEGGE